MEEYSTANVMFKTFDFHYFSMESYRKASKFVRISNKNYINLVVFLMLKDLFQ